VLDPIPNDLKRMNEVKPWNQPNVVVGDDEGGDVVATALEYYSTNDESCYLVTVVKKWSLYSASMRMLMLIVHDYVWLHWCVEEPPS